MTMIKKHLLRKIFKICKYECNFLIFKHKITQDGLAWQPQNLTTWTFVTLRTFELNILFVSNIFWVNLNRTYSFSRFFNPSIAIHLVTNVGRLNGVVSLVTVFEELSLSSRVLFGHVTIRTKESTSFTNRTYEATNVVVRSSASTLMLPPYFTWHRKQWVVSTSLDFSSCSSNACDIFIAWGGNLVPSSYI